MAGAPDDAVTLKDVILGAFAALGTIGTAVFGFRSASLKRKTDAEGTLLSAYQAEREALLAEREAHQATQDDFFDCRAALNKERSERLRAEERCQREIHRLETTMVLERGAFEKDKRELSAQVNALKEELLDLRREIHAGHHGAR